jgi:polyisoprenoid-binding protein YceI
MMRVLRKRYTLIDQLSRATGVRQWSIDPSHSEVGFSVRHLMISNVRGRFSTVTGNATFDPEDREAGVVEVEIDAASIDTRDTSRDAHLRSADFFKVDEYSTITFSSRSVERAGRGNEYRVSGELTIRGVTRDVVLDATFTDAVPDPFGGVRIGVTARGSIDRTQFGLTWNQALETGGVLVGEQIHIEIDAQLVSS